MACVAIFSLLSITRSAKRLAFELHITPSAHSQPKLTPYGNLSCPFEMAVYSQYYMSARASQLLLNDSLRHIFPKKSDLFWNEDQLEDSRAEAARLLLQEYEPLEKITTAVRQGAFRNRTIVLMGDSHMRQLFISIACLIDAAAKSDSLISSFIVKSDIEWIDKGTIGGPSSNLLNYLAQPPNNASHTKLNSGSITLRDGGLIKYQWYPWPTVIRREWGRKCKAGKPLMQFKSTDILVLAAGTHANARDFLLSTLEKLWKCLKSRSSENNWPTIAYMMSPVTHFHTSNGAYNKSSGNKPLTCRRDGLAFDGFQEQDLKATSRYFPGVISAILGQQLDQRNLGPLHPGYGDCSHYLQPGVPDILALDLIDMMLKLPPV